MPEGFTMGNLLKGLAVDVFLIEANVSVMAIILIQSFMNCMYCNVM